MIPIYTKTILQKAESVAKISDISKTYTELRKLPFADFCNLNSLVPNEYQYLKRQMPIMPPDDVQKKWVGDSGQTLMNRTCNIARLFQILYYQATGDSLDGKTILDYGCGWGRLLRIMNYFTDSKKVYGLDVMQSSLDECIKSNIPNQVALCDKSPEELPFNGVQFDLVFSFSIFTHIPKDVALAILKSVHRRISKNGVFILTIRHYEFWDLRAGEWPDEMIEGLQKSHIDNGYAFQTFDNNADINADYGDTTMSFEFLSVMAKNSGWKVVNIQRDLSEPYQIAVALKPIT